MVSSIRPQLFRRADAACARSVPFLGNGLVPPMQEVGLRTTQRTCEHVSIASKASRTTLIGLRPCQIWVKHGETIVYTVYTHEKQEEL